MSSTEIQHTVGGALGFACMMVLAMTGKIDGDHAMQGIVWVLGIFTGGSAVVRASQHFAETKKP